MTNLRSLIGKALLGAVCVLAASGCGPRDGSSPVSSQFQTQAEGGPTSLNPGARSYGVPTPCGLAVCDVPAALQKFQTLKRDERISELGRLRALVAESTDPAVWENLRQFIQQAQIWLLSQRPDPAETEAVQGLVEESTEALAKYSNPQGGVLSRYYGELRTPERRGEVVRYWIGQIDEIEDADAVAEVLDLFIKAEEFSGQSGDASGMAQLARDGQSLASGRYLELNPVSEGTYDIELRGPRSKTTEFINRIVLLQPFAGTGVEVFFMNREKQTDFYSFQRVKLRARGLQLEGEGVPRGLPARFSLRLIPGKEPGEMAVEGWIDSNVRTQLVGKRVKSLLAPYRAAQDSPNDSPIGKGDLIRTFEGNHYTSKGTAKARLVIRMMDNKLAATLIQPGSGGIASDWTRSFDVVRVLEKAGIMTLSTSVGDASRLKIVAFLKRWPGDGPWYIDGVTFSSYGGELSVLRMTEVSK